MHIAVLGGRIEDLMPFCSFDFGLSGMDILIRNCSRVNRLKA